MCKLFRYISTFPQYYIKDIYIIIINNIIKNNTFVWLILVASDSTEVQTLASIGIYWQRVSGSMV